jgi:hypothetical protein
MTDSPIAHPQPVSSVEIVAPDSTRGIYEEALSELVVNERQEAKLVIAGRIKEVQRLEKCLIKAKADLAKLLQKDVSEIALL